MPGVRAHPHQRGDVILVVGAVGCDDDVDTCRGGASRTRHARTRRRNAAHNAGRGRGALAARELPCRVGGCLPAQPLDLSPPCAVLSAPTRAEALCAAPAQNRSFCAPFVVRLSSSDGASNPFATRPHLQERYLQAASRDLLRGEVGLEVLPRELQNLPVGQGAHDESWSFDIYGGWRTWRLSASRLSSRLDTQ
jgi:hypothetical protein